MQEQERKILDEMMQRQSSMMIANQLRLKQNADIACREVTQGHTILAPHRMKKLPHALVWMVQKRCEMQHDEPSTPVSQQKLIISSFGVLR